MKVWRRVQSYEGCGIVPPYKQITDVDEEGNYYLRSVYANGMVRSEHRMMLVDMGWQSVEEFLRARDGFELVEEAKEEVQRES